MGWIAGVAELADARDLGSRGRKALQVRFLSPALVFGSWPGSAGEPTVWGGRIVCAAWWGCGEFRLPEKGGLEARLWYW